MIDDLPPHYIAGLWEALQRKHARERHARMTDRLMVGEADWSLEAQWVGQGSKPESSYRYSRQRLTDYLERLDRVGRGLPPELTIKERIKRDQARWRATTRRPEE